MIENLEKYRFRHRQRPIINRHNMIQLFNDQKLNLIGVMSSFDSHSKNKPTFILSKLKLFKTLNVNGRPVFQSVENKDAP